MKAFLAGGKVGARTLSKKYAAVPRFFPVLSRTSVPSIIRRNQSSTSKPVEPSPWTPHTLNTSIPTSKDAANISKISKASKSGQRQMAYIALGSNLGNRVEWIEKACNMMEEQGIHINRTSCLWETEPMYVEDQDRFLNGVAEVETDLEPIALLNVLQTIEQESGRVKIVDKGPRNIDLDILLYADEVVDHPRLKIPHPLMFEREFVLRPLAELIPGQSLDSKNPWKVTQDYLNELPPSETPMTTVTPLSTHLEPLHALDPRRTTRIMPILNASPDSFSNEARREREARSKSTEPEKSPTESYQESLTDIIWHLSPAALSSGIVDIGGQSTAPGVPEVSVEEESARVLKTIEVIRSSRKDTTTISVDTYRSAVAEAAVKAGAHIINDVSAGTMDPKMLDTMARLGVTVILMHMRGTPQSMTKLTSYPGGLIPTIAEELLERVAAAEAAGVRRWRIILDPGIGFAKTAEQNLEILRRFDELRDWPGLRGLPWLVGSSRKRFIGKITGVEKPSQRTWGTAVTVAAAIQGGADIVRVHDVDEMEQVIKMSDAIWRA
ncbi:folic acid synthesis protein-like protein [Cadophora sp. MPI-SDFR-AT-0126]|nr:folic acid synthesis protein-like protein [Leotiomycetes sp. MPI-SDFR-AT-0126]